MPYTRDRCSNSLQYITRNNNAAYKVVYFVLYFKREYS